MKTNIAPKNVTLSWVTKRGAHCIEDVAHGDLEARIEDLFHKRLEAKAWLKGERATPLGGTNRPGHPHPTQWTWWVEIACENCHGTGWAGDNAGDGPCQVCCPGAKDISEIAAHNPGDCGTYAKPVPSPAR